MAGGRPSKYNQDVHVKQAYELALLGLTDIEMAAVFGVSEKTMYNWQEEHPAFLQALKDGKYLADAKVTQSLYRRATGYEHKAVKIVADAKTGAEHQVEYIERYPPDTTACIFWLKNRQRAKWRDRVENDTTINGGLSLTNLTPAEVDAEIAKLISSKSPK
jgi:transposase